MVLIYNSNYNLLIGLYITKYSIKKNWPHSIQKVLYYWSYQGGGGGDFLNLSVHSYGTYQLLTLHRVLRKPLRDHLNCRVLKTNAGLFKRSMAHSGTSMLSA